MRVISNLIESPTEELQSVWNICQRRFALKCENLYLNWLLCFDCSIQGYKFEPCDHIGGNTFEIQAKEAEVFKHTLTPSLKSSPLLPFTDTLTA